MRTRWRAGAALGVFLLVLFLLGIPLVALCALPLGIPLGDALLRARARRRRRRYLGQFLDFLAVFALTTGAGRTGAGAFRYCLQELRGIHPVREGFPGDLESLLASASMDQNIYESFRCYRFAEELEEITLFGEMLWLASQKGGDTQRIIAHCSEQLRERLRIAQEREVILARQKFELQVIVVLPVVLLGVVKSLDPRYLGALTGTAPGVLALLAAAGCMLAGIGLGASLCDLEGE